MSKHIERSTTADRGITAETIRQGLAETARRKAAPGFAAQESRRLAAAKSKLPPTRFPELAKRGTRPAVTGGEARTQHCKNILRRIERNTPKI
jgi:hypothetical protein